MFTIWRTINLFSKEAVLFYIPISKAWGLQFLYILTNICNYLIFFFTIAVLFSRKWYFIVVLLWISQLADAVMHCFKNIGHLYIFFGKNIKRIQNSFFITVFFLLLGTSHSSNIWTTHNFSHSAHCIFTFLTVSIEI